MISSMDVANRVKARGRTATRSAILPLFLLIPTLLLALSGSLVCAETSSSSVALVDDSAISARDAFVDWFLSNGGTFHPVTVAEGVSANVTADAVPDRGGFGVGLPVPSSALQQCGSGGGRGDEDVETGSAVERRHDGGKGREGRGGEYGDNEHGDGRRKRRTKTLKSAMMGSSAWYGDDDGGGSGNRATSDDDEHVPFDPTKPVISHLQPMFTVPPEMVIGVPSIVMEYMGDMKDESDSTEEENGESDDAEEGRRRRFPGYHDRMDEILQRVHPDGVGLAR